MINVMRAGCLCSSMLAAGFVMLPEAKKHHGSVPSWALEGTFLFWEVLHVHSK
jgi:hypothetical protein